MKFFVLFAIAIVAANAAEIKSTQVLVNDTRKLVGALTHDTKTIVSDVIRLKRQFGKIK